MAHLSTEDGIALVDACLDCNMPLADIVKSVRQETGQGLIYACDSVVYYLKCSRHDKAKLMLEHIKGTLSRYHNLNC